jgi:IclR family acetate operon transcriptional repressor
VNETAWLGGGPTPASGTESATRVADVLLVFTAKEGWVGVTELATALNLNKAVVHRILRSLESRQLVVADGVQGRYSLGPAAAAMGARALRNLDLRQFALPVLRRLQSETNETATVSTLVGLARVYLDQVVSQQEIKMTVELGRPFSLVLGASSRALLSASAPDLRSQAIEAAGLSAAEGAALERELDVIAAVGFAHSSGERQPGAASVAAPVLGPDGHPLGAISVCGPTIRFDDAAVGRYGPLIRAAAAEVSAGLRGLPAVPATPNPVPIAVK